MRLQARGSDILTFRSPDRARGLVRRIEDLLEEISEKPVKVMHMCGTHEQSIAKFGLRSLFPRDLEVIMGPGCPVCVTSMPEVDEAIWLAEQGAILCTYGDMMRVPGSVKSLQDAKGAGADVRLVYSPWDSVRIAIQNPQRKVVFFASGFETTAPATAAIVLSGPPDNFTVLSAHKYIPPAMDVVAAMPDLEFQGWLAAGHAATITGYGVFEEHVRKYGLPIVVAGFEPLDILYGFGRLLELIRDDRAEIVNAYPRSISKEGNVVAQKLLWRVFETMPGEWRGIAYVPDGHLELREEYSRYNAREQYDIDVTQVRLMNPFMALMSKCICGEIMSGRARPTDCEIFGKDCVPESPVGACMVSSEGTCKIWHMYGGYPDLSDVSNSA